MVDKEPRELVLPLLALRNLVMFPGVVTPLRVGRPRSLAALERATGGDGRLVLLTQRHAEVEDPGPEDLYDVGVISEVRASPEGERGAVRVVIAIGLERCRILEWTARDPCLEARVERLSGPPGDVPPDLLRQVKRLFTSGPHRQERHLLLDLLPESAELDAVIAFHVDLPVESKQALLAEPSAENRYRMLVPVLEAESRIAREGERIWNRSVGDVSDAEREQYLRDRMADVRRELSELSGESTEVEDLRRRVREAELPDEARIEAERELTRMGRMAPGQPERNVAEDYLDWLLGMPWHRSAEAAMDLPAARRVLDRDHYDRAEVKERVLEYLSVRKLSPGRQGALVCFVGAPGVGKTSMGRSIAEATGRPFYRVALGGVRDEAEIRGHRRTYLGARPGCIIRALRTIGVNNPVIMLDELDKLAAGPMGDPAGALLEVLDPEQNVAFVDAYLAVAFDLSNVMFVATANTSDTIPPALLDRLEVIELPGYTTGEKVAIAARYLVPKQVEAAGLEPGSVALSDEALELLVERYTREAGVRNLERQIASLCRKLAREQEAGRAFDARLDAERVQALLGPPLYFAAHVEKADRTGLCPTLAVGGSGGELLYVEVSCVDGSGRLLVTGRAGQALTESASLALSFWKSRARDYGLDPDLLDKGDVHVHFPGAATPKEGASAGLPIALALVSRLSGEPLPAGMAAVGEITLHGRVLPVDHVPERLAAAARSGIVRVLLPAGNRAAVEAARERALPEGLELAYVSSVEEALRHALAGVAAVQTSVR